MRLIIILSVLLGALAVACNEKEVLSYPALTEYYPLKVGRTYTYRLDSTVTVFGSLQPKYYRIKDSVESQFNDAQGRPSFRIWRYITDSGQVQPWKFLSTQVATIDENKKWIEYVDNNLRFIVLHQPLKESYSWKGNSYIDTKSGSSPVKFMDEWDYTYQDVDQPYTVRKGKFDSTITVLQVDEVSPPGPFDPSFYQQTNYAKEVYAKGVGLIYKELIHKTWQINPGRWDDDSYEIKLTLVDFR
ncbi:MAG: hypothetical protein K0Q66_2273 [Chitinophagaceae bacterium]|jgi:hypothetical protein|nr:hypothetical protein [Chitinophagaceae bacterium]